MARKKTKSSSQKTTSKAPGVPKPPVKKKGSRIKNKNLGAGTTKGKSGTGIQLLGETQRGDTDEQIARFKQQALYNMGLDESALDPSPGMGPALLAGLMVSVSCYVGYKIAFS